MAGVIYTDGNFQGIDNNGKVVALGTLKFTYTSTGLDVTTYQDSDLTIENTNPILLSASGKADVFLKNGIYDVVLKDAQNVIVWSKDDFIIESVRDLTINEINTIADLRVLTETFPRVWLTGYNEINDGAFGSNFFKWDATSVEADNGGTIIKLDSIATGRYILQYSGVMEFNWFGPDNTGVNDSFDKLMSAINATSDSSSSLNSFYPTSEALHISKGRYRIDNTVKIHTRITIYGDDSGLTVDRGTTLVFPEDVTGFEFHSHITGTIPTLGQCSVLKGLSLKSTYGVNRSAHGVHLKVRTSIIDVSIVSFSGSGIYGDSNEVGVNFNLSEIRTTSVFTCHNGLEFLGGDDANACNISGLNIESPYNWGVYDVAYYANVFTACHFGVSGTATGGAVYSENGSFYSCYAEGNNECYFGAGVIVLDGTLAAQYLDTQGTGTRIKPITNGLDFSRPLRISSYSTGESAAIRYVELGSPLPTGNTSIMTIKNDVDWTASVAYSLIHYDGNMKFTYKTPAAEGIYNILGPSQTQYPCGRDVSPAHALKVPEIFLGETSYGRSIRFGISATASTTGNHGKGDIVFNINATAGGYAGWICTTASIAGAGAVWKQFGAIEA